MKKQIVEGSPAAFRSQLNYFQNALQPTDTSIASTQVEQLIPWYPIDKEDSPLQFHIQPSSQFTDLNSTVLYLQLKIVRRDGASIMNDSFSTVNLLASSLFSKCEISVNGKSLAESDECYGLR